MRLLVIFLALLAPSALAAGPPDAACSTEKWGHKECIRWDHFVHDTCQLIETVSKRHGLDQGFFTRLIWQESRFDPFAKSHASAMGIAQFIASTAKLRGLTDPYNPADALEHSAEYLSEMAAKYGNVGLAAIAYNGGERRAEGLIAGTGGLAQETIDYVKIITGADYHTWASDPPKNLDLSLEGETPREACYALAKNRRLSAPPETKTVIKPWGVQLAFGTSKAKARAKYREKTKRCAPHLKGMTPDYIFEESRASKAKGYFFARIGRSTSDAAWKLCTQLKASGCLCAVYRNAR